MDEATDKMRSESVSTDLYRESTDDDANTEQIRAEIEDTRAEMSQTINEIQERLSPEHLMGQVKETVREATIGKVEKVMDKVGETLGEVTEPAREAMDRAGTAIMETGRSVGNSIWRNPIPVALIGVGLGMLVFGRKRGNGYDYTRQTTSRTPRMRTQNMTGQNQYATSANQPYGTTANPYGTGGSEYGTSRSQYGTSSTLDSVKEKASDLASRSTDALSNLGSKAKDSASAIGTRFERALRENPLAVGAVAVAAGTAVGLVLPATRFENEYIGETSEKLVDRAEQVAREAIDKVQNAAHEMGAENQ